MAVMKMLLERSLYDAQPPALQTRIDINPTLLVSWWCTIFALVTILIRVAGRFVRTERLFREDKIMFYSIIPLLIRMGLVHVVLIWGTNNTTTEGLTRTEIRHREIGSKLVLASRIFYAAFIWISKFTVVEFMKRLVGTSWHKSYQIGIRIFDGFLVLTFVAVVITTLSECHPFSHYWQVVPDPGPRCREGMIQLVTMGVCDIVTDVVLIVFPIPLVVMSSMPVSKKVSLVLLFLLSLVLIAITAYRVPTTIYRHSSQPYRSLLASLEILAAAAVANAIVIGSFIRDRGVKKAKYRAQSVGGASDTLNRTPTRSKSIAMHHWGSDEDLVRELGLAVSPDLQHHNTVNEMPRVAPVALPDPNAHTDTSHDAQPMSSALDRTWNFGAGVRARKPEEDDHSISSTTTDLKPHVDTDRISSGAADAQTPRRMSFFDVGGLVENLTPPEVSRDSSIKNHSASLNQLPPHPSRQSSRAFLSDVGGLISNQGNEAAAAAAAATRIQPGSIDRRDSSQELQQFLRSNSHRNFTSGYRSDNQTSSIAEHGEPLSTSRGPGTTSRPPQDDGPNALVISDAGGLLG